MKNKLFSNLERLTSIFGIAIIVITVTILLLRLTVLNPKIEKKPKPEDKSSSTTDVSVPEELNFEYIYLDHLVFKDFNTTINPYIQNPSTNTAYMMVKIIRDENYRSVYESSYIRPGVKEATMTLSGDPLPAGIYNCTAEIYALDPTTQAELGVYKEPIIIEIQNSLEGMDVSDIDSSGDSSIDSSSDQSKSS